MKIKNGGDKIKILSNKIQDDVNSNKIKYWILSGSKDNWRIGITSSVWGVRSGLQNLWEKLQTSDVLIFYATSPISGIIGFGRLETKFKQDKPLWKDEIDQNKVIYPFRFEFKIDYVLPERDWDKLKININDLKLNYWGGINSIKNIDAIKNLDQRIKDKWLEDLSLLRFSETVTVVEKKPSVYPTKPLSHKEVQEMVKHIGELQRFISETEYPMDNEKLDIVWRKVAGSVPTYVFEVQLGGDIYHALGKLKHAWDIWNSNIFLIVNQEHLASVQKLLSGTFHEISSQLKIIPLTKVEELYKSKTRVRELEQEFGILKILP
jgi:predicted RNA-binding protein